MATCQEAKNEYRHDDGRGEVGCMPGLGCLSTGVRLWRGYDVPDG